MTANVTNELLLDHLGDIQAKIAQILSEIADFKADNRAHRSLTTGLVQSEGLHGQQIAALQARLERIERRLELNDQARPECFKLMLAGVPCSMADRGSVDDALQRLPRFTQCAEFMSPFAAEA